MENDFGNVVQRYRELAGLTQDELAKQLDISQQTVGKWESGKSYPRPAAFARLMQALQIPAAEIMNLYGESKGARSPMAYSDLVTKQIEWNKKQEAERSEILNGASEHVRAVAQRLNKNIARQTSLDLIRNEIKTLMHASKKDAKWGHTYAGGSLAWAVDYADRDAVVKFEYAESPVDLSDFLRDQMRSKLWNLATLRAHLKDERSYIIIIIMSGYIGMDSDADDAESTRVRRLPNEVVLRRLTAEAALLGISIFVTNTPHQVITLLKSHGTGGDFTDESFDS